MLEIAAAEWKLAYERADFDSHPKLWAGYFVDDRFAGSLHTANATEKTLFWLATPYVASELSSLWTITDNASRLNVHELRSAPRAFRLTSWWLPYTITDHGRVEFEPATKRRGVRQVEKTLRFVGSERIRNGPTHSYATAFQTALWLAENA